MCEGGVKIIKYKKSEVKMWMRYKNFTIIKGSKMKEN